MTTDELTMDEFYTRRINELAVSLRAEYQARVNAEARVAELEAKLAEYASTTGDDETES